MADEYSRPYLKKVTDCLAAGTILTVCFVFGCIAMSTYRPRQTNAFDVYRLAITLADANNDGTTTEKEWRQFCTRNNALFIDDKLLLGQPFSPGLETVVQKR